MFLAVGIPKSWYGLSIRPCTAVPEIGLVWSYGITVWSFPQFNCISSNIYRMSVRYLITMSAAVARLDEYLTSTLDLKPPGITGSKVQYIAKSCTSNIKVDMICPLISFPWQSPHMNLWPERETRLNLPAGGTWSYSENLRPLRIGPYNPYARCFIRDRFYSPVLDSTHSQV